MAVTVEDTLQQVSRTLAGICAEPIGAALVVHRAPDTGGGLRRLFGGGKDLPSRLRAANQLVLTPTHVRLFALGGRSGMDAKEELGAWPLGQITIYAGIEERSTWFASTGSSIDQHVFRLRLMGPALDLTVDAMAYAGLDDLSLEMLDAQAFADETDPDVREAMAGLQEMSEETATMVAILVRATGGGQWMVPAVGTEPDDRSGVR
jgi:hypothetical protein